VTTQLVRDLVKESKKNPEKLREAKLREKKNSEYRDTIQNLVSEMQQAGLAISSARVVQ